MGFRARLDFLGLLEDAVNPKRLPCIVVNCSWVGFTHNLTVAQVSERTQIWPLLHFNLKLALHIAKWKDVVWGLSTFHLHGLKIGGDFAYPLFLAKLDKAGGPAYVR